jgi:hypothetical protein
VRAFDPGTIAPSLTSYRRHLAYMAIWALVFGGLNTVQAVGDDHPGQWLPFWQEACDEERPYACRYLEDTQAGFCDRGSGWSCNELGIMLARRTTDLSVAVEAVQRGCALGYEAACVNARRLLNHEALRRAPPTIDDYPIILRGSKGPLGERTPAELQELACKQGWSGLDC